MKIIKKLNKGPPHTHISHSDDRKQCYFLGHLSPSDGPGLILGVFEIF